MTAVKPGKKRTRTMSSSSTQSRKYKRSAATQTLPPNTVWARQGPLPKQLKCSMLYSETFNLDPSSVNAVFVFSANGLYDPNITGVGHQPRGFDQLMALYDHYVVIGCKAKLQAWNSDASNANIIGMTVVDQASILGTSNIEYLEHRGAMTRVLGPSQSGSSVGELTMSINPNKFLGRSKPLSDSQLKGNASGNPTEQAFIHVFAMPQDGNTDTTAVRIRVLLEFTAVLIEPRQPASS